MKTILKLAIIPLCLNTALSAEPLKLDDLIKAAILHSPDIKIDKAAYEAAEQRSFQADANYLPQVNFAAQAGKQNADYGDQKIGIPPNEITIGETKTNLLAANVNARQLIYDFGKTTGNMQSSQEQANAYKAAMQQGISNKIYAVKEAYYTLLYNYALIDVNKENIKLNEQQLYRSKRYYDAGIRTKIDVTDAKVNLIEAELTLQTTSYDTKLAAISLKKEIGFEDIKEGEHEIYIEKPRLVDVYTSLNKLLFPVQHYVQEAYKNRAELEQYRQVYKSYQSRLKQIKGDYYPDLFAEGNYLMQKVDEEAFAPEKQWKAILALEWNLYSGHRTSAQDEEARINVMKAQADFDNTKLRIQKEVNDAYININKQLDNIRLSENLSIASLEKFEQAQKRYEHGLADYIELQQSRQSYIDSRARLTQGYYRYYTAMAQLDRAIGK